MAFDPNESGAALCRTSSGGLVMGPISHGTPMGVNVKIQCPPNTKFEMIWHSHPNGVPEPSSQDIKSLKATGAKAGCITATAPGKAPDTRCYERVRL